MRERPDEGGRCEVDTDGPQVGALQRRQQRIHEIAVGGRDEDSTHDRTVDGREGVKGASREQSLVRREGNDVERLKANGGIQLGVGDVGHLDLTSDGAQPCNADVDLRRGVDAALLHAPAEGLGDGCDVEYRAINDGARWEADHPEVDEFRLRASDRDLRDPHRTIAYLYADIPASHVIAPVCSLGPSVSSRAQTTVPFLSLFCL